MNERAKILQELVRESHYIVDTHAVAEAILLRMMIERALPDARFRNSLTVAHVRSFRPDRGA